VTTASSRRAYLCPLQPLSPGSSHHCWWPSVSAGDFRQLERMRGLRTPTAWAAPSSPPATTGDHAEMAATVTGTAGKVFLKAAHPRSTGISRPQAG
jgi:hypothetical protein